MFTLTPEFGLSWLYDDIWENRGPEVADRTWENEELFICRAATFDNPFVPADAKADAEFTEEEYRVKVLGEFFHIKGLVYDDFKPEHVVSPPSIQHVKDLDVVVGIDPGYRTTAVVFVGFDKDNIGLVFDELYLHKDEALPPNTALQIKLICKKWGISPRLVLHRPDGLQRHRCPRAATTSRPCTSARTSPRSRPTTRSRRESSR